MALSIETGCSSEICHSRRKEVLRIIVQIPVWQGSVSAVLLVDLFRSVLGVVLWRMVVSCMESRQLLIEQLRYAINPCMSMLKKPKQKFTFASVNIWEYLCAWGRICCFVECRMNLFIDFGVRAASDVPLNNSTPPP